MSVRWTLAALVVTAAGWLPAQGAARGADPLAVLRPDVKLADDDYTRLEQDEPVVKILPARDRQIRTFAATATRIDDRRFQSWIADICALKRGPHVLGCGQFSAVPSLADLEGLALDSNELDDIRGCEADDCGLKVNPTELLVLRRALTGPGGVEAANLAFKQVLLQRVRDHLMAEHRASPAAEHVDAGDGFGQLPQVLGFRWSSASSDASGLRRSIEVPGGRSFIYWSREHAAGKPIVTVTEVTVVAPADPGDVLAASVNTQLFATRYMDGSHSLTVLTRCPDGSHRYLAYLNQSTVDVLDGMFGGVARMMMSRRIRSESGAMLRELRTRMERGNPPDPGEARCGRCASTPDQH
jgi:hypothetical protein